ncbi:MAG: glycosyltransferase [Verrucomicrobia bacterium]|nr:glycosyltransferase [Verrucomicrobiota bacterium]
MTDRRSFYENRAQFRVAESDRLYHQLLKGYFSFLIPPNSSVLEIGCGLGDLLAALGPARGLGVDFSSKMITAARARHPHIEFQIADAVEFKASETFDYILLSDLVNDLPNVQAVLTRLHSFAHPRTRLVINFFNHLWHPILVTAERAGAKAPTLPQNWLSTTDMTNLLYLSGWDLVRTDTRILWPIRTPLLEPLLNRWLAPCLRHFCLTIILLARPQRRIPFPKDYRCSVIVPARNEAGNIEAAVRRTPEMGLGTEFIFVEGGSTDKTWEEIQRVATNFKDRNIKVLRQQGSGKGGAVREAFAQATGDLLFILDADLTVPPEQLTEFYEVARSGIAEFVNGVRLVYPMEDEAMRFLNMLANKCFSLAFSWLLGQTMKDTLCGTKVLFKKDYEAIEQNRSYFGDFDPFGDFDLLFGAAKLNLKIVDLPVRYRARTYGETNIHRWRHGLLLCRMVLFAARRLKFINHRFVASTQRSAGGPPSLSAPN